MKSLVDRFAEVARTCEHVLQLRDALSDAALELGFHHFALLDHASLTAPAGLVRIDNYPEPWVKEFVESGYAPDDPIHVASRRSAMGFSWGELGSFVKLEHRHKVILSRSRHHGLGEGFTIPANIAGEPSASCSFVVRRGTALPVSRLHSAQLVGAHALHAARRLRSTPLPSRPRLSRREVECLKLVARGKSDWEISRILGISIHTARQYVKRARSAYDAVSRSQLIVYALRDSWISFDDAIPQFRRMD